MYQYPFNIQPNFTNSYCLVNNNMMLTIIHQINVYGSTVFLLVYCCSFSIFVFHPRFNCLSFFDVFSILVSNLPLFIKSWVSSPLTTFSCILLFSPNSLGPPCKNCQTLQLYLLFVSLQQQQKYLPVKASNGVLGTPTGKED